MHRSWRLDIAVILALFILALALTWPLAAAPSTRVPGDGGDDPPLTWNLWWIRHSLLEQASNPFQCDLLFYPLGINLAFYTLTLLNGFLSLPLQATVGLVAASNILLLSSFVVGGYGAFLLARHVLGPRALAPDALSGDGNSGRLKADSVLPALAAALLYAFASSKLFYAALGQWNIASSHWIPYYVLYLLRATTGRLRWRDCLLAVLFLLLQAYAELTYASFLVLFTGLWLAWIAASAPFGPGRRRQIKRTVALALRVAVLALLFLLGIGPVLANMLPDMRSEGSFLVEGSGFAGSFSADLLGFLIPTMHHPLLGRLVERFRFDHTVGQHLYLGYSVLALAGIAVVAGWRPGHGGSAGHRRAAAPGAGSAGSEVSGFVRFWTVSSVAFWLLSLGPRLRINGRSTSIPLPFDLVARLPFFEGNRYPSRYSVLLFLSLALLVALGVQALLRRASCAHRARRLVWTLSAPALVLMMLFEHLSIPLPTSDMRVPPVYSQIAQDSRAWTLLDIPVAWRNGFRVTGTLDTIIMFEQYYQTVHGKRVLAGNTSRNPPLKFQYFVEAPVISSLVALETGHALDPGVAAEDRLVAPDLLRFLDIQGIVVHADKSGPEVIEYIESTFPVVRVFADDTTVAYRVELPDWPASWDIRPGRPLVRLSLAEGWGVPAADWILAQRHSNRLLVPMVDSDQEVSLDLSIPGSGQSLAIEVNGHAVGRFDLAAGTQRIEARIPVAAVQPGLNDVILRFDSLYPAGEAQPAARAIGSTGVRAPANLVVQSAGLEVGDLARIYVDGLDVSPNERGYNIVVLDPASGDPVQVRSFDTHLDEAASREMASFIDAVPQGFIVAVAAADEASRLLGAEAVKALHGIGAQGDLRERFRWGHAVIGVRGAPPGSAVEAVAWMQPATVVVGAGSTEPMVAAALSGAHFRSVDQ